MLYHLLPARSSTTARLGTALLAGLVLAVGVFAIAEPVSADQRYRIDVTTEVDPNFRSETFNVDKVKFYYGIVVEEDGTVYRHLYAELLVEAASQLTEKQEGALHMSLTDNRDDFLVGGSTPLEVRPAEIREIRAHALYNAGSGTGMDCVSIELNDRRTVEYHLNDNALRDRILAFLARHAADVPREIDPRLSP